MPILRLFFVALLTLVPTAALAADSVNIHMESNLSSSTSEQITNSSTVETSDIQNDNFVISDFRSQVNLQTTGWAEVVETITVDFGQNPHHGIYRTLPITYSSYIYGRRASGITVKKVTWKHGETEASAPYTTTPEASDIKLKIGDANKLDTGIVVYTIEYSAAPVHKNLTNSQRYLWNVTGSQWTVPITKTTLTLMGPANWLTTACYAPAGTETACTVSQDGQKITAAANTLRPGEQLTAGGELPAGTLTTTSPVGRALFTQIMLPFALPVLALVWLLRKRVAVLARKNRRTIIAEYDPPQLEPGLADAFIDGDLTGQPIPATLVDLARRGEMTIEEKKGLFWHKNYLLHLKNRPSEEERPLALAIANVLFNEGTEQSLDDVRKNPAVGRALINEPAALGWLWLVRNGYFTAQDDSRKILLIVLGVACLVGSGFLAPFVLGNLGLSVFYLTALGLTGFILLFSKAALKGSELTEKGIETYRQVMGFRLFMHTAERYRQQWLEKQGELDQYLPWAMVFGLTTEWLKKLESLNIPFTPPVWYVGSEPFDSSSFASNFSSAMTSFSSAGTSSGGAGSGGGGGGGGGW